MVIADGHHQGETIELGDAKPPAWCPYPETSTRTRPCGLLRELSGPDERIVLMLHNSHAQRLPMQLLPEVRACSAGSYLDADLGTDYAVLGVTAVPAALPTRG